MKITLESTGIPARVAEDLSAQIRTHKQLAPMAGAVLHATRDYVRGALAEAPADTAVDVSIAIDISIVSTPPVAAAPAVPQHEDQHSDE